MKTKINKYVAPDLSGLQEQLSVLNQKMIGVEERVIEGTDYTRDIKNDLKKESSVLDVGCAKAFLLHEMKLLEPKLNVMGFDISKYALEHNMELTKPHVYYQKAQDPFKYKDKEIDLVISLNLLHNLRFFNLKKAISEINRVGKQAYVVVESYRNEKELFNLQCWATVCESFFDVDEWIYLFGEFGYVGDYEFIFFE